MRNVLTAIAYPALLAATFGLLVATGNEVGGIAVAVALFVSAAFGAVLARWWVLVLPAAWIAVAVVYTGIAGIATEEWDEGWLAIFFWATVLYALPLTVAMLAGVLIGRARLSRRSRLTAGRPARPAATSPPPR